MQHILPDWKSADQKNDGFADWADELQTVSLMQIMTEHVQQMLYLATELAAGHITKAEWKQMTQTATDTLHGKVQNLHL